MHEKEILDDNPPPSYPSGRVAALAWSTDSELLAVVLAPLSHAAQGGCEAPTSSPSQWTLQVWHRSNWHWYLKHQRCYPGSRSDLLLAWDEQHAMRLHVVGCRGMYECIEMQWESCVSHIGTVAVVDGRSVLLTPLR